MATSSRASEMDLVSIFSLQLEKALCVVCLVTSDTLVLHVDISFNYQLR